MGVTCKHRCRIQLGMGPPPILASTTPEWLTEQVKNVLRFSSLSVTKPLPPPRPTNIQVTKEGVVVGPRLFDRGGGKDPRGGGDGRGWKGEVLSRDFKKILTTLPPNRQKHKQNNKIAPQAQSAVEENFDSSKATTGLGGSDPP